MKQTYNNASGGEGSIVAVALGVCPPPSCDRIPFGCSNRQIVDHPEGGTAYADCGFCPGCENKDRLDQQELEIWEAA